MLSVTDIHTYYGNSYVLQGVNLEVSEGKVAAVIGRNGMGKTTLIRSVMGFTQPRRGRIIFRGIDITRMSSHKIFRMRMGLVPQGRRIFPSLTVRENLAIALRFPGVRRWDIDKVFQLFPRLKERQNNRGNALSGGEQQMLAIARALVSNPAFILMDEPTEGLAPMMAREVGEVILGLKKEGLSILLVEQNLSFALKFADYSHVMNKGIIIYSSSPEELWKNEEIKKNYLGV
jgi:branched-chain amino acid transport system ATP-binding protein